MTPQTNLSEALVLRPRKASFVFSRIFWGFIFLAVFAGLLWLGLTFFAPDFPATVTAAGVFVALTVLNIVSTLVAYRKESYELHASHIRCCRGGLLSDQTTELDIRNITQVKIRLPWIRYKLFGIGHVFIESAGTSQPALLRFIRNPESVYDRVRELMKNNGYSLKQNELFHEERPALIGVLFDCIGILVAGPLVIFGFASQFISADSVEQIEDGWRQGEQYVSNPWFLVIAVAAALIVLLVLVFRFLDLRRRTYRVYDDVVVYEEGFLSRDNAFIPFENVADAETKRTLIDQIFGLYDVHISCQGSNSEVKFRRLRRGPQLLVAIDNLVVRASQKIKETPPSTLDSAAADTAQNAGAETNRIAETGPAPSQGHPAPPPIPAAEAWTAQFRIHSARLLVPAMFLLPLIPIWIAIMIRSVIELIATTYEVRPNSVRQSYKFLNTEEREFAFEKITGIVIKRNPWDRLFSTMTIRFWSIGSGRSLEFAHVKTDKIDLAALKRQAGIPEPSAHPLGNPTSFSLPVCVMGRLPGLIAVLVASVAFAIFAVLVDDPTMQTVFYAAIGILLLATIFWFLYSKIYHRRQKLSFHESHVEAEQGILFRQHYFACYRNLKKTVITHYPGKSDVGSLQLYVAGEQEAMRGRPGSKEVKGSLPKPCSFTSGFLPSIEEKRRLIDDVLAARVSAEPDAVSSPEPFESVMEGSRSLGNSVVKTILFGLFPLFTAALPFTLPYVLIATRRWEYRVESGRVVVTWGILFRRQATILLDRVDSIRHYQGAMNKIFKNGSIDLMTAGSSKPDLTLANSPDYLQLYQEIRSRSSSAS